MEKLTPAFLQNVAAVEDLVRQNLDCSNMVMAALFKLLAKVQINPDLSVSKMLSIGGEYTLAEVIEVLNSENRPVIVYPDLPMEVDCG